MIFCCLKVLKSPEKVMHFDYVIIIEIADIANWNY